jgi:flagellar basal body-associated protein FliL
MSRKTKILVLLGVFICVLVAFAVAAYRARSNSASAAAMHNLKMIDAARKQWEAEQAQRTNAVVSTNDASQNP